MECFDRTVEDRSKSTAMLPAHVCVLLNTGWRTCTETCGLTNVFPPDGLRLGSDTEHGIVMLYVTSI